MNDFDIILFSKGENHMINGAIRFVDILSGTDISKIDCEYSLSEIAKDMGISKEACRQIELKAIYKLKKYIPKEKLELFVDTLNEIIYNDSSFIG